jgi:tungstate transport system substrate-binding protein
MIRIKTPIFAILIAVSTCTVMGACSLVNSTESPSPNTGKDQIILATTTSTQDSGLLDFLLPMFHEQNDYLVKTIAVGTGKALRMAEDGNADVLLVHAPPAEKELLKKGHGIDRSLVMHNDFVIVGPPNDPAGISNLTSAVQAFHKILNTNAIFVSRGDDSGTHKKEITFWNDVEAMPQGDLYLESGQGMGATLRIASEKGAYTLTDRATYLVNQDILHSSILVEGDNRLLNIYHVILVNPQKWPQVNYKGAQDFTAFLLAVETQEKIGGYGVDLYGQPLFIPDAGKSESDFGLD